MPVWFMQKCTCVVFSQMATRPALHNGWFAALRQAISPIDPHRTHPGLTLFASIPAGIVEVHRRKLAHALPAQHVCPSAPQQLPGEHWPLHQEVPVGHAHVPPWHVLPLEHGLLQPPQWLGLVVVSTHWLPQSAKPPLHATMHLPVLHTEVPFAGSWHGLLHPPQCCLLVFVSTQLPSQLVYPDAQLHPPFVQVNAGPHAVVQSPQCCGSLLVFTHEPLQFVSVPQVDEQLPFKQTSEAPHGFPQFPQAS